MGNPTGFKFIIDDNGKVSQIEWNDYDYETNQCYEIIVDEENPVYCSIDGVLFNKNVTELIYYPVGKFELPLQMLIPIIIFGVAILALGVYNGVLVNEIVKQSDCFVNRK